MLTGYRIVSEDRDVLSQRSILLYYRMTATNEIIECQSQVLAGHILGDSHSAWQLVGIDPLQVEDSRIVVNFGQGNLGIFLVAKSHGIRRTIMSTEAFDLCHCEELKSERSLGNNFGSKEAPPRLSSGGERVVCFVSFTPHHWKTIFCQSSLQVTSLDIQVEIRGRAAPAVLREPQSKY
jgi:hypothetical protein